MDNNDSISISFDKKQLKLLIKSLALADFVRTSYQPDKIHKNTKEKKMISYLLQFADQMGFGHWVRGVKNPKLDDMKEMDFYEDIQVFEALSFWNTLAQQLAERDMDEIYGDAQHLEMKISESMDKELDIQDKYLAEFDQNGLQNLRLINPTLN